jgi:RNA polymerase sigma-70 factor, ECF subfamily
MNAHSTALPAGANGAPQQDLRLVSRLQARDPLALAELYDRYGSCVYRVALALVRDTAAAEDLTQEAFLHIWNRAASFDSNRGSLASWVRVMVRNLAIDYLRSAGFRLARRTTPLEHAGRSVDINHAENQADSRLAQLDRIRLLQGPWTRLRPSDRQALRLAYYGGFSQPEIAARLNRPLGTVKSWMRRGLESLRAELEDSHACR